jgi:excisionase family DNA binding protein
MSVQEKPHLEPKSHALSKNIATPQVTPTKGPTPQALPLERQKASPPQGGSSIRESTTSTRLLTLKEAADRLAISLPTIRSWVWQRKIEIVKIGRCVRIREQVISDLIATNTVCPRPANQEP